MMKTYPMAYITQPGTIEFREKVLRDPQPDEVLIAVKAAAICGSDLHLIKGKHPAVELPVAVGHELAGQVIETGKNVRRIKSGDRVTVEPVIACGACYYCLRGMYHLCSNISFQYRKDQGAFTTHFYANEDRVFKIPESMSYAEGALVEPFSVALHAVKKSAVSIGQSGVVFGAGAIGLLITALLRQTTGMQTIVVDVNDYRLAIAKEMGATLVVNNLNADAVTEVLKATDGLGCDHAFEAVGLKITLIQALEAVRKGGRVMMVGIFEEKQPPLPVNLFIQKELTLSGSQGYVWDFEDSIELISKGIIDVKKLITHRFLLSDLQKGFDLLQTPGVDAVKVIAEIE